MARILNVLAALALGFAVGSADAAESVKVFAAASIAPSVVKIADLYKAGGGGDVVVTPAASGALAKQIEAGAPADIFLSANVKWMDWAKEKNLVKPDTVSSLVSNSLVLVTAKDAAAPVDLADPKALPAALGDERLAIGEAKSVPAGAYGEAALKALGLFDALQPKFAPAENVRVALQMVARGEAKYGIVYGTDAKAEPGVAVVATFPESSHEPIVYPIALTASASGDAAAFLTYLKGPEAKSVYEATGFVPPAE